MRIVRLCKATRIPEPMEDVLVVFASSLAGLSKAEIEMVCHEDAEALARVLRDTAPLKTLRILQDKLAEI